MDRRQFLFGALATGAATLYEPDSLFRRPTTSPRDNVVYGVNAGGWVITDYEQPADAYYRIKSEFRMNAIRWWASGFSPWTSVPPWILADIATGEVKVLSPDWGGDILGINAGYYDATIDLLASTALCRTYATVGHEPENEVFDRQVWTLAEWQQAQMRVAQRVRAVANPLVSFGPCLMGGTYNPDRYTKMTQSGLNVQASVWLDYDLSSTDFIAGDFYQWGSGDSTADPAARVLDPAIELAVGFGRQLLILECGALPLSKVSDNTRMVWYQQIAGIIDSHPGLIPVHLQFESDRGPTNSPCCLLGYSGDIMDYSPSAATYYQSLTNGLAADQ
jgi:hypothetical protein